MPNTIRINVIYPLSFGFLQIHVMGLPYALFTHKYTGQKIVPELGCHMPQEHHPALEITKVHAFLLKFG